MTAPQQDPWATTPYWLKTYPRDRVECPCGLPVADLLPRRVCACGRRRAISWLLSSPPPDVSRFRIRTRTFEDGLGVRVCAFDHAVGQLVEVLCLRPPCGDSARGNAPRRRSNRRVVRRNSAASCSLWPRRRPRVTARPRRRSAGRRRRSGDCKSGCEQGGAQACSREADPVGEGRPAGCRARCAHTGRHLRRSLTPNPETFPLLHDSVTLAAVHRVGGEDVC